MKIERKLVDESTIEDFADKNDLIMSVVERKSYSKGCKFYASFKNCDIANGGFLIGEYGDGENEEDAIKNYSKIISLKTLVVSDEHRRRKIACPRFAESNVNDHRGAGEQL